MTEEQARAICRELGATLSIRQRRGKGYIFVSRWLPRAAAEAAGHQASSSSGQQFDRYVSPLAQLGQISPDTLKERIAALPLNPNKDARPGQHPATASHHTRYVDEQPKLVLQDQVATTYRTILPKSYRELLINVRIFALIIL